MSVETAAAIVEHAGRHAVPVYAHTESLADFADAGLTQRIRDEGIWYIPTLSIWRRTDRRHRWSG
jgi:hypothetical protein